MRDEDPLAEVIREEIRAKDLGPPTTPILREMAMLYRERPGFDWRWL